MVVYVGWMRLRVLFTMMTVLLAMALIGCSGERDGIKERQAVVVTSEPTSQLLAYPTLTGTAGPAAGVGDDAGITPPKPRQGRPLGGAEFIKALDQQGIRYAPTDHGMVCNRPNPFGVGNVYGGSSGPSFILFVYPSPETLAKEWDAAAGEQARPLYPCIGDSDHAYWNKNLVLVFGARPWADHEGPRRKIAEVFLGLTPP